MSKWTDTDEIKKLARFISECTNGRIGLTTYSPGDGVTRYRLGRGYKVDTPNLAPGYLHDYFGDRAICTALGRASALVMLQAFTASMDARRDALSALNALSGEVNCILSDYDVPYEHPLAEANADAEQVIRDAGIL